MHNIVVDSVTSGLSILIHDVISLPSPMQCDKCSYSVFNIKTHTVVHTL